VADWVIDDQPTWIQGTPRPMLSVPYTVELNDIPLMAIQHHRSDELYQRGVLQMERLVQESARNPRVMAISVHPYITGVPHRIAAFEKLLDHVQAHADVAIMPGVQVADWYSAQVPPQS
jgi:plasmid stability protein